MKILDGQTLRDMTDQEIEVYEMNLASISVADQNTIDAENLRISARNKLTKLGLTEAEVSAVLGG